jgi:hypothetical protein
MTKFVGNNNQGCLWALIGGTIFLLLKSIILFLFWKWFISEPFGIIEINYLQSMGIWCVVDLLRFSKQKKESTPTWLFIIDVFANYIILLILGLIIHTLC